MSDVSVGDVTAILRMVDEFTPVLLHASQTFKEFARENKLQNDQLSASARQAATDQKAVAAATAAYVGQIKGDIAVHERYVASLKEAANTYRTLGRDMVQVGGAMTMGITLPMAAAGVAVAKFFSEFETNIVKLQTMSAVTEAEAQKMGDGIREMAEKVGIGAGKLSEAMLQVTSTGIRDASTALDVLNVSAKASSVGLGDVTEVAKTITSAMAAYGKENLSAAEAGEILYKMVVEGKGELAQFAGAMGRVVGMAAMTKVSLADAATFIATFTRTGGSAAEAVTALRNIILRLDISNVKTTDAALKSLGLSIGWLRKEMDERGLTQTLVDLINKFGATNEVLGKLFPNLRGLNGAMTVAGAQAKDAIGIWGHMKDRTTELNAAVEKTQKTLAKQWKDMLAALENLAIEIGVSLRPQIESLIKWFLDLVKSAGELVKWFSELPSAIQTLIGGFTALLFFAGPVLALLGNLSRAISLFKDFQVTLAAASTAKVVQEIGLAASGVDAVGTAATSASLAVNGLKLGLIGLGLLGVGYIIKEIYDTLASVSENDEFQRSQRIAHANAITTANKLSVAKSGSSIDNLQDAQKFLREYAAELKLWSSGAANPDGTGGMKLNVSETLKQFGLGPLAKGAGGSPPPGAAPSEEVSKLTEEVNKLYKEFGNLSKIKSDAQVFDIIGKEVDGLSLSFDKLGVAAPTALQDLQFFVGQETIFKAFSENNADMRKEGEKAQKDAIERTKDYAQLSGKFLLDNQTAVDKANDMFQKDLAKSTGDTLESQTDAIRQRYEQLIQALDKNSKTYESAVAQIKEVEEAAVKNFTTDWMNAGRGASTEWQAFQDDVRNGAIAIGKIFDGINSDFGQTAVQLMRGLEALSDRSKSTTARLGAGLTMAAGLASQFGAGLGLQGLLSGAGAGMQFGLPGALIGGALGMLGGLFSSSAQQEAATMADMKAHKELNLALVETYGSYERLLALVEALRVESMSTGRWNLLSVEDQKKEVDALAKKYSDVVAALEKYGLSMMQGGEAFKKAGLLEQADLLYKEWTLLVNAGFKEVDVTMGMSDAISKLIVDAISAGQQIPHAMYGAIDSLIRLGGLTEEARRAMLGLQTVTNGDWSGIKEAMGRYDLTAEEMGGPVLQMQIDEQSSQLLKDWNLLTKQGGNQRAVGGAMSGQVQDIVNMALQGSVTLDASLRPMIEYLSKEGLLKGDISKIEFVQSIQETMSSETEKLLAKLQELIEVVAGPNYGDPTYGLLGNLTPPRRPPTTPWEYTAISQQYTRGQYRDDSTFENQRRPWGLTINISAWDGVSVDQWLQAGGAAKLGESVVTELPAIIRRYGLGV